MPLGGARVRRSGRPRGRPGSDVLVNDLADVGERVKIEVTEVKSNFAVGEIIDEDI